MRLSDTELEEGVQLAKKIIKRKSRRITLNADDLEAFDIIYETFKEADECANPEWLSEEHRKIIGRFYKKIYGKK